MSNYWLLLVPLALIFIYFRNDLRREMISAGLLAIPVVLLKPLLSKNFLSFFEGNSAIILFFSERIIMGFCFGVISSAIYEIFLQKRITPQKHPHRAQLWLLCLGFIIAGVLFSLKVPLIYALIVGFLFDLILIAIVRFDLILDMLFSGLAMGSLYLTIYLLNYFSFPGDIQRLWFTNELSGLTVFSLPVEEVLSIMLFGALLGPLYVAIKGYYERKSI